MGTLQSSILFTVALACVGCDRGTTPGSPDAALRGFPAGWPTDAERTLAPGRAPTAFTAEQIRTSGAPGRRYAFRATAADGKPKTSFLRFVGGDETTAKFEMALGEKEDDPGLSWRAFDVPWKDLQSHGSFPATDTTITFQRVTVPAGTYDAALYTVRKAVGEKAQVTQHWFALDLPGPPVRTTVTTDGKTTLEQVLLRTSKGP